MEGHIYRLEELRHAYQGRRVLEIDRLAVRAAEILAIVGPSGAGKSTLLRLLNFLEMPDQGRVFFDGTPVRADLPLGQRRRVTTVFQRPFLLNRSVSANLGFGLRIRGERLTEELKKRWLQRLGLSALARRPAPRLSAGEAQRLAVARALIVQPDVLLLDEPTANLDPANVALIESIVRSDNQHRGTTIVLVTHNIFQARRMAHRTALLLDGKIIELAETETFFGAPSQSETAAFVRGEFIY